MKKYLIHSIPEIYLLIGIIYYWSLTANTVNWIAIALLILVVVLLYSKNRALGLAIGSILIIVNLYLFLALFSELFEFDTFNASAKKLFFTGTIFLSLNILLSGALVYKYATKKSK